MKKAKRVFKTIMYILLISLACLGVGLSGGVPMPRNRLKRDPSKDKTELVEKLKQGKDSELKKV